MLAEDLFSNPGVVSAAIGVLAFVISYVMISLRFDKGVSLVMSVVIGFTGGWYLYSNNLLAEQPALFIAIGLAVAMAILLLAVPFVRFFRKRF